MLLSTVSRPLDVPLSKSWPTKHDNIFSFISRWRLAEQRICHYSKSPDPGQGHQKNQAEKSPKMAIKIHPFFVMNIAAKSTSKKNKEQLPSCSNSQIGATSPVINSSKIFQF